MEDSDVRNSQTVRDGDKWHHSGISWIQGGISFQICRNRACYVTREAAFCKLHSKISGRDLRSFNSRDQQIQTRHLHPTFILTYRSLQYVFLSLYLYPLTLYPRLIPALFPIKSGNKSIADYRCLQCRQYLARAEDETVDTRTNRSCKSCLQVSRVSPQGRSRRGARSKSEVQWEMITWISGSFSCISLYLIILYDLSISYHVDSSIYDMCCLILLVTLWFHCSAVPRQWQVPDIHWYSFRQHSILFPVTVGVFLFVWLRAGSLHNSHTGTEISSCPTYMVIDLKVLARSFNCKSRACYVGNPRERFFFRVRGGIAFFFAKVSRKLEIIIIM